MEQQACVLCGASAKTQKVGFRSVAVRCEEGCEYVFQKGCEGSLLGLPETTHKELVLMARKRESGKVLDLRWRDGELVARLVAWSDFEIHKAQR